jgi:dolichyl-phosphate-mannose--protein O-mannosyl transferase
MNGTYFDEIYHARTAYEHTQGVSPYEVTHPPLGKLLLGIGIRLFGMVPFGWRFMGTLFGVLMLPAMYLLLKKMLGGTLIPACGTAILASDFMHFAQTRIATIDTYVVLFILLMYGFFWCYWDAPRTRRSDWLPPLALSGVCFGLGAASKWTGFYAGGGLAVLWLIDRVSRGVRMYKEGKREAFVKETVELVLWSLLFFVLVPACIYYLSYWPYGTAKGMHGLGMLFSKDYLRTVWDNQKYMLSYHSNVTASHPYSSVWWQWVLDIRPILYYLEYLPGNREQSIGAWLNPLLCWGGLCAMVCMVYQAAVKRDRAAAFILIGYLAQLVPWLFVKRVVFEYHYFPSSVFLLLALAHVFRTMELRRAGTKRMILSYAIVSVVLFAAFYPALTGIEVPRAYDLKFLKWLGTWPF